MPIRINFLAEEQAADDLRRQDPVKRAILGGVVLVVLTLGGWGVGLAKVNGAKSALDAQIADYDKLAPKEKEVIENLRKTADAEHKLGALLRLATNRFSWGPVLNAFQMAALDNVQVTSLKGVQSYVVVAPVPKKDPKDPKEKSKPGTSTENVVLVVEGYDSGPKAEKGYIKYKDALANSPYFKENLSKEKNWRFKGIPEEVEVNGKTVVQFKLEGLYPDKVRDE